MIKMEDAKELEMYIKHLTIKFVQCVVHSRCVNNKLHTQSKILLGPSTADWFNLALPENPTLLEELKGLYGNRQIDLNQPLCIDIFLKTTEDETMLLEHWWVKKNLKNAQSKAETCNKVTFYSNLITMLKSLVTITRSVPGYNLARKQSSSMYKLYYRLKFGEPVINDHENFKQSTICKVPYPVGLIEIRAAWKTKLLFEARRTSELLADLKDDYFNMDPCPVNPLSNMKQKNNIEPDSLEDNYLNSAVYKAAFGLHPSHLQNLIQQQNDDMPFSTLLEYSKRPPTSTRQRNLSDQGVGIILENSDAEEEIVNNSENDKQDDKQDQQNDFVMVELKAPFACHEEELAKFYRECQKAPELSMFEEEFDEPRSLMSIEDQIAMFEKKAEEYKEFVKSLQTKIDDGIDN